MNIKQTNEGWYIIEGDSHVGAWIEQNKKLDHDDFLIPLACSNMRPGWVVMDCGALYGDHSIAYARTVGKDGAVIAIEANKLAFECLSKNAEKFEAPMFCMNLALCDFHGGMAVHIMDEHNVGASKVTKEGKESKTESPVRTATIDGIVTAANLDRLDFIKIDCEGWELSILKGANDTLKKFRPVLLIEMNSWALSQQDASYKDIYDYLLKHNYAWRIAQPEAKGGDQQYDILCWPSLIQKIGLVKTEKV